MNNGYHFPPASKVHKDEPVNGMSIQELFRFGYVHLETVGDMVHPRFSKPMLRILATQRPLNHAAYGHRPFLQQLTAPTGKAQGGATEKVNLSDLFSTCRDYHGETEEMVQLLSFLNACAAYVLLTPASRPKLESLADLRPGAQVVGDDAALRAAVEVLKAEVEAMDAATEKERVLYESIRDELRRTRAVAESGTNRAAALDDVSRLSSDLKVAARHDAFLRLSARHLCARGGFIRRAERSAALTAAGTTGVDAWVRFGGKVYAMQCKGQDSGAGAGRAGSDATLQPKQYQEAVRVFHEWLSKLGDDTGNSENVAGLELLTTKHMTDASKASATSGMRPVVVVARDSLRASLGLFFGGIAARCAK